MHVERIYCDSLAHSSWQTRVLFIGVWRPPHPNQKVGGSRKLEVYNGGSQACEWSEGYNHSTGINPNPPPRPAYAWRETRRQTAGRRPWAGQALGHTMI